MLGRLIPAAKNERVDVIRGAGPVSSRELNHNGAIRESTTFPLNNPHPVIFQPEKKRKRKSKPLSRFCELVVESVTCFVSHPLNADRPPCIARAYQTCSSQVTHSSSHRPGSAGGEAIPNIIGRHYIVDSSPPHQQACGLWPRRPT